MRTRALVTLALTVPLAGPAAWAAPHDHHHGCGHHHRCAGSGADCRGDTAPARETDSRGGAAYAGDRELFHFLLDNRERIERELTVLPDGVATRTESDDSAVAAGIRQHVAAMYGRMKRGRPIHRRDPLFAELFDNAVAVRTEMEETDKGMRVRERSDDPYVARLIQEHARVVSLFLDNGRSEMRRDHALPGSP